MRGDVEISLKVSLTLQNNHNQIIIIGPFFMANG